MSNGKAVENFKQPEWRREKAGVKVALVLSRKGGEAFNG